MKCGYCKVTGVNVEHVKGCANNEQQVRSVGSPAKVEHQSFSPLQSEGIFWLDGYLIKVIQSEETGRFYAKRWNLQEWEYAGSGPLHFLTEEHRVSADIAAQFGALTGRCVFCNRKLTDEASIAAGFGPVCAGKNGLSQ